MNHQKDIPPARGERSARLGYGAQDRVAAWLVLEALRDPSFFAVRLADLEAGQVDDFVLVWDDRAEANSIKWSGKGLVIGWSDLLGPDGLIRQLAAGWQRLKAKWPEKRVMVCLRTNRPPSNAKTSPALRGYSVAEVIENYLPLWSEGQAPFPSEATAAHEAFRIATDLSAEEFSHFLPDLCIRLSCVDPQHDNPGSRDAVQWEAEFDRLRQVINDRVADPSTSEDFTAADIRVAVGLPKETSLLAQRFPDPEIGYESNESASQALAEALGSAKGGYVALVGPAGAGKSTLVQTLIQSEPLGIPYFAYLPAGAADPRERGDSLTFFRYLIAILDTWGTKRRAHAIADLAQAREALTEHINRAAERYSSTGRKTVVLVDGLDHVTRESGMSQPLYLSLPLPDEVKDGFVFLISTQPQALIELRPQIQSQLQHSGRTVSIPALSTEAVHRVVLRQPREFTPEESDRIYASCQGNPLILTYVLKALASSPDVQFNQILESLGTYGGDIEVYYSERLNLAVADSEAKQFLGLLSRMRGKAHVDWLAKWPEFAAFETKFWPKLQAFFRVQDGWLSFLHNSLVLCLQKRTLPSLPGISIADAERRFHQTLAERLASKSAVEKAGRERIYHLVKAGEHRDVIDICTSEWIREAATAFVAPDELKGMVRTALRSAFALDDTGAVIRLIASLKEIDQRSIISDSDSLASKLLDLGQFDLAIEQVHDGPTLRVEAAEALKIAQKLAVRCRLSGNQDGAVRARYIFDLAKPVHSLYSNEPVDHFSSNNALAAWASAAPFFASVQGLVKVVSKLVIPEKRGIPRSGENVRAELYFKLCKGALEIGDYESAQTAILAIDELGEDSYWFTSRIALIRALQRAGIDASEDIGKLATSLDLSSLVPDARILVALCYCGAGNFEQAKRLIEDIHLDVPERFGQREGNLITGSGRRPFLCAYVKGLCGMPEPDLPEPTKPDSEGTARLERACVQLGTLRAALAKGERSAQLHDLMNRLIAYARVPVRFSRLGRHQMQPYPVATPEFVSLLLDVVAEGGVAVWQILREATLAVAEQPKPSLGPDSLRTLAVKLFESGVMSRSEAVQLVDKATSDEHSDEADERTAACFDIARTYYVLGASELTRKWFLRASEAAHGVGSHKDYQMATWAEWLEQSMEERPDAVSGAEVQLFARAVDCMGGHGGREAAQQLLRSVLSRAPSAGVRLAIELVERQKLHLHDVLEAVLVTFSDRVPAPFLVQVFCRLYSLLPDSEHREVVRSLVSASSKGEVLSLASVLASAIRTNTPPSRRVTALRTIQFEIEKKGLVPPNLVEGLELTSKSESDSGLMYRTTDGDGRSVTDMAFVLSDPAHMENWDSNREGNKYFAWEEALALVTPISPHHLKALELEFGTRDRRTPQLLSALSGCALRLGDRPRALHLAEEAKNASSEGGWIRWLDGAAKRFAFEALISLDPANWLPVARAEFIADLVDGKIGSMWLHRELPEIFKTLRWEWPKEPARQTLLTQFESLTSGAELPEEFESLRFASDEVEPGNALAEFLVGLLSNPVSMVAAGSRSAVADRIAAQGIEFASAFERIAIGDSVTLERALMALDTAGPDSGLGPYKKFVLSCLTTRSIAARSLAARLCRRAGWEVVAPTNEPLLMRYELALPAEEELPIKDRLSGEEIPGAAFGRTLDLYQWLLRSAAKEAGLPLQNLQQSARQYYREVERLDTWSANGNARLHRWRNAVETTSYVRPQAVVAREAVMRVLDDLTRSGRLPEQTLDSYDSLVPAFDANLDRASPEERPAHIAHGLPRECHGELDKWGAFSDEHDAKVEFLSSVGDRCVLAERTIFVRPELRMPEAVRCASIVGAEATAFVGDEHPESMFGAFAGITRSMYEQYEGNTDSVAIFNGFTEISSPASQWLALNPLLARHLGWSLAPDGLFRWLDGNSNVMVESFWWRDGWIGTGPYHSEQLGEGWIVYCTEQALEQIRKETGWGTVGGVRRQYILDEEPKHPTAETRFFDLS